MDWRSLFTMNTLLIIAVVIITVLIIIIISIILKRRKFRLHARSLIENPLLLNKEYSEFFEPSRLIRRSNQLERAACKYGLELLDITGITNLWLTELKRKKNKKLFRRVLKYYPEKSLFTCFMIALEKKDYAFILKEWLNNQDGFLITRKIALSGVGEDFSGEKALAFFQNKITEIREMTGDPLWPSRYFAIKILLYDSADQSKRAIWESINDPHPLIRKTIASEFYPENRDKFYNELFRLYLKDPVREVRTAAKERINRDFTDVYTINIDKLDQYEALHALEHLSPFSKSDEDTALHFLDSDNLELRFSAACFLKERGALNRLIEESDLGDRENIERVDRLLRKSCEVNISSFLEKAIKSDNTGTLYIAAGILAESGDVSLIEPVCKQIFSLPQTTKENKELFERALLSLKKRGTEPSFHLLNDYLKKNSSNYELTSKILEALPSEGAIFFIPTLLSFLEDDHFPVRDELRKSICRMPSDLYILRMLEIIKSDRQEYSHVVRKDALKILIQLKKSFCLQTILENLPILPANEAKELAELLVEYDRNEFDRLTALFLKSDDSSVRASIITCLPAVNGKNFLKEIKNALNDADPEIRIASIWALVEFGETKTLSSAVELLRDPVERVRMEVALAIGKNGSEKVLEELRQIIFDENEVQSVKIPAIHGLGFSESLLSIEILCDLLEQTDYFDLPARKALSQKIKKKEITTLINRFKDGSPTLRDKITLVFSEMGEAGEEMMISLLKEDIAALKPHICQVLEATGFIESQIRFLKHRDPKVRRIAADELSYIGTSSAFRGIVLAARDSNKEVRVAVTRALEELNNDEGTEILRSLEEDPDRKVRKYTAWAMERLNSKNSE